MELKGLEILQPSIVCMNKMYLHSYKFTPVGEDPVIIGTCFIIIWGPSHGKGLAFSFGLFHMWYLKELLLRIKSNSGEIQHT